jgi:hypothetical protein
VRVVAALVFGLSVWLGGTGCAEGLRARPGVGASYPSGMDRSETLNVQVFLRGDSQYVEFTNTTARSFGPSRLWVNRWFSTALDGLAIGETVRIPVGELRDEHGSAFKGGGFFAIEAPDDLLLAELESAERLYGLIVVEEVED